MSRIQLTRRALLGYVPAATIAAAVSPLALSGPGAHAQGVSTLETGLPALAGSIERAFRFQNFMMDAYTTGTTVRLTQSYSDEALGATAFTYDNAVTIHAYLASEDAMLLARAEVLGDGLLYAQANNFPFNDGRFAQGYFVNAASGAGAYITPAAAPYYFYTSTVGDQAWAGMALAQLYHRTGQARFLTGALLVANWIVTNAYNTAGVGGYSFGTVINQYNGSEPASNGKSTEHNIDTFAFFTMLSKLTKGGSSGANGMTWGELAGHALTFVVSQFNAAGPFFYTGTLNAADEGTNLFPIPEDCQTWSYLALLNKSYAGTIDWALEHLEATDTAGAPHTSLTGTEKIHGLVFDTASLSTTADDPDAVWLEGTSHTIAALAARALRGSGNLSGIVKDVHTAAGLVGQCMLAQAELGAGKTAGGKPIPAGEGLLASTSVMDTGFGYTYGPSLHIGATGWYLLGALAANPFQLGYRIVG